MDYDSIHTALDEEIETCDYCGAKYSLIVPTQAGHNEREDYYCPECQKRHYVRASLPIMMNNIRLIKPRTDGKTDRFSNTDL